MTLIQSTEHVKADLTPLQMKFFRHILHHVDLVEGPLDVWSLKKTLAVKGEVYNFRKRVQLLEAKGWIIYTDKAIRPTRAGCMRFQYFERQKAAA